MGEGTKVLNEVQFQYSIWIAKIFIAVGCDMLHM